MARSGSRVRTRGDPALDLLSGGCEIFRVELAVGSEQIENRDLSVAGERGRGFRFQIEILVVTHVDPDGLEARCLIGRPANDLPFRAVAGVPPMIASSSWAPPTPWTSTSSMSMNDRAGTRDTMSRINDVSRSV